MKRLIAGHDKAVAEWTFEKFSITPHEYEMCIGIVEGDSIVGSIFWTGLREHDVEISYFGPNTMTLGIARACAKMAVDYLGVSRVTARTSRDNKTMTRGIKKIGFEYEGIIHNGYGDKKDGVMYGLYGEKLARLAGKRMH